jgi:acyl-CoA reductase-like NAD-dependent aldehyde dehydrogenase
LESILRLLKSLKFGLRKMGDLLEERQQEMAEILTKENGKPLAEAKVCF